MFYRLSILYFLSTLFQNNFVIGEERCSCRQMRKCYADMIKSLRSPTEAMCVEMAIVSTATVLVYLNSIKKYCPNIVKLDVSDLKTFEGRHLYQVQIGNMKNLDESTTKVIMVDAGMSGGQLSTSVALYLIQQLVACEELEDMITGVKWIILPSVNPDCMEFNRYNLAPFWKNMRRPDDELTDGVDLSRNFPSHWSECGRRDACSPQYEGSAPASENETLFIKGVMDSNKQNIKAYVSLRTHGHSIFYPYGYSNRAIADIALRKVAESIAMRVNQKSMMVSWFTSGTLYSELDAPHCGSSVDYAYESGVPLAFQLNVFYRDEKIIRLFHSMPKGFASALLLGYFSGMRELFLTVVQGGNRTAS